MEGKISLLLCVSHATAISIAMWNHFLLSSVTFGSLVILHGMVLRDGKIITNKFRQKWKYFYITSEFNMTAATKRRNK